MEPREPVCSVWDWCGAARVHISHTLLSVQAGNSKRWLLCLVCGAFPHSRRVREWLMANQWQPMGCDMFSLPRHVSYSHCFLMLTAFASVLYRWLNRHFFVSENVSDDCFALCAFWCLVSRFGISWLFGVPTISFSFNLSGPLTVAVCFSLDAVWMSVFFGWQESETDCV